MSCRIEAAIQAALIKWVLEAYPHLLISATANEKSYKETRQIGSIGITDLLLFKRTRIVHILWLELKKKKGKLQPSQVFWNQIFDKNYAASNSKRAVAYGFLEAQEIIKKWEVSC